MEDFTFLLGEILMKKQEEYILQFDFNDKVLVNKELCKCCNKEIPSKMINSMGYCIECVMNNIAYENKNAHPNELLYKKFCKFRRKNNFKTVFKIILAILFLPVAILLLLLISDSHKQHKTAPKKVSFKKGNQTTVYIHDYNWVCPCCALENQGPNHCERCGVYPQFKLIE